jgi:meso-butanediol dehydrogenase / (S,S)-butanediol dehydrogenase / diacetyl reductase
MAGRLSGKVAVLTGTGRGIARAVALRFAAEGASVVGCDLDPEAARETVDLVRSKGGTMESMHPLDLMDEKGVQELLGFAVERFGGIDILFNSARGHRPGTIEDTSLSDWRWTLDHTLGIQFLVTKYAIPHLRARGKGSIIFVASISGLPLGTGFPGNVNCLLPYSVAKAGVIRLAIGLAHELAPAGIRVNAISPGNILASEHSPFYGDNGRALRTAAENSCLMERLGSPDEIADAALFLASEEASFITGHNLLVDGGFAASGGLGRGKSEVDSALSAVVARNIDASGQTGRSQ